MAAITFADVLGIVVLAALGSYFIVGLAVVGFLFFRGPKWPRRGLPRGMLWEPKDHRRNTRWWFMALTSDHPLLIALHVVAWPLWFMTYLDELDEEEAPPTQYLGPSDDEEV
jgi:hypothetical protein